MSKLTIETNQLQSLVSNLTSRYPKTTFTVAGKTYLASKVVALAQSVVTARAAISTAVGNVKSARNQAAQIEDEAIPILTSVRIFIVQMLSNDVGAMNDLGVAPRKTPKASTVETRVTALEKNRATRQARGTMGKVQKAKLKGNVTGVIVTPVTSSAPAGASAPVVTPAATLAPAAIVAPVATAAPVSATPAVTPSVIANLATTNGAPVVTGH